MITVPATAVLGSSLASLAIGLRVLNLDGTEFTEFSTDEVVETSVPGTYRKVGGVTVPDSGGYIVWGVDGTDYAETTVDSTIGPVALADAVAQLIAGLSGSTVTVLSFVDGSTVTVHVADTWRFTVASDQLDLAEYETLGLVVKRHVRQADSQALLYLRSDTGLVRIGGAAPASAGNGMLTKTATSFTAVVHVAETQGLVPGGYTWWLKGLDTTPTPDEAVTLATGEFVVLAAGLQAVV